MHVVAWNGGGWNRWKLADLLESAMAIGGTPHVVALSEIGVELPDKPARGFWSEPSLCNLEAAPRGRAVALMMRDGVKVWGTVTGPCFVAVAVEVEGGVRMVVVGGYIPPVQPGYSAERYCFLWQDMVEGARRL